MLKWFAVVALVGILVLVGIFYFAYKNTTIPDANKAFEAQSTYVYYSGGKARSGGSPSRTGSRSRSPTSRSRCRTP